MSRTLRVLLPLVMALVVASSLATLADDDDKKLTITGVDYTKWLWGTQRLDGSLYNFTSIPSEGFGDVGQGHELELLLSARPSKIVEVSGRMKARFNQNQWTNFGGFGGDPSLPCVGGDCGEFDPRSNQYVKLRGLTVTVTPEYSWLDRVTIGSSDWGMFDAFSIGKIRYIDRDNGSGLLFQGTASSRKFSYDVARISLPRLWAGPNYNTGEYTADDAAYGLQLKFEPSSTVNVALVGAYVDDQEIDLLDVNRDDGRHRATRFRNTVAGVRLGVRPSSMVDIQASAYTSTAYSDPQYGAPSSFFGLSGFGPVPANLPDDNLSGEAYKVDFNINDPWDIGLSFNLEYFDFGEQYVSMMAARRESDVLLTEGHDGTFAWPGPNNVSFGVFNDGNLRIGYGGWQGNAQQVATINVDNEFTDFDEPMAETVIGWKGFTIMPVLGIGDFDLTAEYTYIDYNTNWQAWGEPTMSVSDTIYPNNESDAGVGSFRNAYAPFQDKETEIMVLKGRYFIDKGRGFDVFGKIKYIDEQDRRLNDPDFLPFAAGDCPMTPPLGCAGVTNPNDPGANTAGIYGNPPVITVTNPDGSTTTGYQWKPFDDLSDDDRDMEYWMYQLGVGTQVSERVNLQFIYEYYDVDLQDGNTAFQAYNLHEMASGKHEKNKFMINGRYILGGIEFGLSYEYNWGEFKPDYGGGFVVQYADPAGPQPTEQNWAARSPATGSVASTSLSPGFRGRFTGWNSLEERDFEQMRLKAFMKLTF